MTEAVDLNRQEPLAEPQPMMAQGEEESKTSPEESASGIDGQTELMSYISEMLVLISTGDDVADLANIELVANNIHQKAV